jgi:hypothetical protein
MPCKNNGTMCTPAVTHRNDAYVYPGSDPQGMRARSLNKFWVNSYRSDRKAFWLELVGFLFTVAASMYLAINANAPDMRVVYPVSFVGVIAQVYASYRRGAAWVLLLTSYFVCINVFGFGRAMGWY